MSFWRKINTVKPYRLSSLSKIWCFWQVSDLCGDWWCKYMACMRAAKVVFVFASIEIKVAMVQWFKRSPVTCRVVVLRRITNVYGFASKRHYSSYRNCMTSWHLKIAWKHFIFCVLFLVGIDLQRSNTCSNTLFIRYPHDILSSIPIFVIMVCCEYTLLPFWPFTAQRQRLSIWSYKLLSILAMSHNIEHYYLRKLTGWNLFICTVIMSRLHYRRDHRTEKDTLPTPDSSWLG